MRENWFRERLTAAKQAAPMWVELADTLTTIFSDQVEPLLVRLKGMTSTFTMTQEDLDKRINELGSFFYLSERVAPADWPLALMQRQDEIHLKKTDYPLVSTISREFAGMQVTWEPLYAPIDQEAWPYGSRFTIKSQLPHEDIPEDQWFLTARGVIRVPMTQLRNSFPDSTTINEQGAEFEAILERFIRPLIPLHIAYDGAQYFLQYTLKELEELLLLALTEITQTSPPAVEAQEQMGRSPADISQTMPPMNNGCDYRYSYQARFDAISLDAWTVDRPLPGAPG